MRREESILIASIIDGDDFSPTNVKRSSMEMEEHSVYQDTYVPLKGKATRIKK